MRRNRGIQHWVAYEEVCKGGRKGWDWLQTQSIVPKDGGLDDDCDGIFSCDTIIIIIIIII